MREITHAVEWESKGRENEERSGGMFARKKWGDYENVALKKKRLKNEDKKK